MRSTILAAVTSLIIFSLFVTPALADNEPWWLRCEGGEVSTNLTVFDNAPEFSAINGEAKWAVKAQIQVSTDNSDWDPLVWDSGNVSISYTNGSVRCPDVEYGCQGNTSALETDTTYFWRIRFYYEDDSVCGWSASRFSTGDEFRNYRIYFATSSSQSAWPYGSPESACNDLAMLGEVVAALNGDNNSNRKNYTVSDFNLAAKQNKFRIVLLGGTYDSQIIVPAEFDGSNSSSTYHITVQNNPGETPIINHGTNHSDLHRVIVNANYTKVSGITACGAISGGYAGFYTNRSYVEFLFCNASSNDLGFIIGGENTSNIVYDLVNSCNAQNNYNAGIKIYGGTKWTDIYNCTLHDQSYGIYVEPYWELPEGQFYVDCCTVRSNTIYNNGAGIFFNRDGSSSARDFQITEFNRIYNNNTGVCLWSGLGDSAHPLVVMNNIIYNTAGSGTGIQLYGYSNYARIQNNTFYKVCYGIYQQHASASNQYTIKNNIICVDNNSAYYGIYCEAPAPFISCNYNDIYRMGGGFGKVGYYNGNASATLAEWQNATPFDDNSISLNPRLVNPDSADFHLKSMAGHFDEATQNWMNDSETSECIDKGDPSDSYANEPSPNGGRINIGCYGNTVQASKSWDNSGVSIQEPEFITKQLPNSDYASDAAYCDVNRDGLLDIYLVRTNGDNRLYLQCENGDFIDVAASAGVTEPQHARSARFADLDGDGDFDLVVTCDTSNQSKIYINKFMEWGNVSFTSGATGMNFPANASAITYIDYDKDGDQDVYVATSGTEGGRLFRNNLSNGVLSFTDVSANAGELANVKGVFDIVVLDVNNDGRYDLFLSRPDNADLLLVNNGNGSFTDQAATRGVNHGVGSRGVRAADFNGDGYVDLFLGLGDTDNNVLYINNGYGYFTDGAATAGVNDVKANGVAVGDFSSDGKPDIYVSSSSGPGRLFSHKDVTGAEFWNIAQIKGVEGPATGTGFPKAALLDRNSTVDLILTSTGADNSVVCLGLPPMQVETRLVTQLDNGMVAVTATVNRAGIAADNVTLNLNGRTYAPVSAFGATAHFLVPKADVSQTETPFDPAYLSATEAGQLTQYCSFFPCILMYSKTMQGERCNVFQVGDHGYVCFVVYASTEALQHSLDLADNYGTGCFNYTGTLFIQPPDVSKADLQSPFDGTWGDNITVQDIPFGVT
jgi:hypothetical protein